MTRWAGSITETSPLFNQCTGVADPDGGANFSPDCGIVVTAQIFAMPDNPDLERFFQVGVVDQAGGYAALTKTEQALQAMETQRNAPSRWRTRRRTPTRRSCEGCSHA